MPGSTSTNNFYKQLMDFVLTNSTPPLAGITTFYIGLFLEGTTLAGARTQVYTEVPSNVGYQRVQINRSSTSDGGISGWQYNTSTAEYSNSQDIIFGVPTGNWGTITGLGIFLSPTFGSQDMIYYSFLTTPKSVSNGDGAPKILAGQLRIARAYC